MKAEKSPVQTVMSWIRRQPPKVNAFFGVVTAMTVLVFLKVIVHEHDNLFIASEAVHALGISLLIYKLTKEKTCAGISLKTQELTALFLAVRLYCSFVMEFDLHTLLDSAITMFRDLEVFLVFGNSLMGGHLVLRLPSGVV
ncbi:hypothetical protein N665_1387s0002 [Sinapis alba]|nr:hypothetical protein N665_1387s0002 [Sinapis alba]